MGMDQANLYSLWSRSRGKGGTSFSTAAEAIFEIYDSLGDGLTNDEKTAMAVYIDAEIASGNDVKKDYETIYGLSGSNGLVDYIGSTTATAVNAPTHSVSGYTFNGSTQYINSGFNLSSDSVNYKINSAQIEVFNKEVTTGGGTGGQFFGCHVGSERNQMGYGTTTPPQLTGGINSTGAEVTLIERKNSTLYSIDRFQSSDIKIIEDGSLTNFANIGSGALSNIVLYAGARNNNGTADQFMTGTLSSLMIGDIMASQSERNTNIRTLLTALGTI